MPGGGLRRVDRRRGTDDRQRCLFAFVMAERVLADWEPPLPRRWVERDTVEQADSRAHWGGGGGGERAGAGRSKPKCPRRTARGVAARRGVRKTRAVTSLLAKPARCGLAASARCSVHNIGGGPFGYKTADYVCIYHTLFTQQPPSRFHISNFQQTCIQVIQATPCTGSRRAAQNPSNIKPPCI